MTLGRICEQIVNNGPMIRPAVRVVPHRIDRVPRRPYIAAMAIRDILVLPDQRLREISKPATKITAAVKALVDDMFETMYDAPGIGLAAIQIGVPERIVTMDLAKRESEDEEPKPNPRVFINPEIVWSS